MSDTPTGLGGRGSRLWSSLLAQDVLLEDASNPMREVALEACRTADLVESMHLEGDPKSLGEIRQQRLTMTRLISALRLPDEASGKRPQRRQLRGVQKPSKVSSLERARQAHGA